VNDDRNNDEAVTRLHDERQRDRSPNGVVVGAGYYLRGLSDLLALGFTWGRPSAKTYGDELQDEYTVELLYRLQLTHRLCLSPDVQVLIHPARNPDTDVVAVFGLRARLVFW
jgi:porin